MKSKNKNDFNIMEEAYKNIRTNIEFNGENLDNKVILITSSKEDEGKSTVLYNLAESFAAINKKVLIIDGDLRNPSIHKIYGLHNNLGLTNIINQSNSFEDCVNKHLYNNIDILTSGISISNPSELISSNEMKEFINDIKEEYDYIFIDSSPIAIVTDASIIASIVDSAILVVAANEIDKKLLELSKDRLEKSDVNILGVIFNKYKYERNSYYYRAKY